jgi:hypothetical protein
MGGLWHGALRVIVRDDARVLHPLGDFKRN